MNRVSRPRSHTGDVLCYSGVPPGRTPLARSRKVRSTLGWWNAWRACSTLHEKRWLLRKHGTFHPHRGLSVFWGGGKGLPVTYSSTQPTASPLTTAAPGSRGGHQHLAPPRGGSSGLDVDTQERSTGWDLLQGGAPRAASLAPALGAARTRAQKLLVYSWEMLMPQMLVGSLPDLLSLRLSSSCCPGRRWLLRKDWMVSGLPDPLLLPRAAAVWIHSPFPGQGGSSDLCSWPSFGGESQTIPPARARPE